MPLTLDEALTPTDWSNAALIFDRDDFAGVAGIGYPTVVKVDGRLSAPIDDWYMWLSPHDDAVVYLASAPSPAGPWTIRNSGNPVLTAPSGTLDVAAPHVVWNPTASELWMWAHCQQNSGDFDQPTYFWKSTNGLSWTIQNGGNPVLPTATRTDRAYGQTASYLTLTRESNQFRATFQGVQHGGTTANVCEAQSADGLAWATLGNADPIGATFPSGDVGYDAGRPVILDIAGRISVYYVGIGSSDTINRARQFLGDATWSAAFDSGIPLGPGGSWNDYKCVASDFVHDGDLLYCFVTGDSTATDTDDEAVGYITCDFPTTGFDTTWGKG